MIPIEIEKAIKEMEPTRFEAMINDIVKYIYKSEKIDHIEKVGMSHGSLRTKKGTPDIKIITTDKNIAIQCSVEKNIERKIDIDISKCLEVATANNEPLHEICFCCNSNISFKKIQEITNRLKVENISFKFIGIDDLRSILYLQCPIIAQDYLNVRLSTGALVSLSNYQETKKFKSEHDAAFLYRDEDKSRILDLLSENNVIISGKPGDGKTRLALEIAQQWSLIESNSVFVLDNNTYDFTEDFRRFLFSSENQKLLLIDDINRISILDSIMKTIENNDCDGKVHILATVRDYAEDTIMKYYPFSFKVFKLKTLSKEEIKNIISKQYNIKDSKYLDYILSVSKGNLRFSIMAAKTILKDKNSFPTISDIIENYYNEITKDLSFDDNSIDLQALKTLGIFSFFQKIYIKDPNGNLVQKILKTFKLNKDEFEQSINYWDNKEIIKYLFDNNIASMDDQILRTYIFKLVFIDKKYLSLYDLIKHFFSSNLGNLVDIINSINYVYGSQSEITKALLKVQNELYDTKDSQLYHYLEALQLANPAESINMIEKSIRNGQSEFVPLLLSYCETEYFKEALEIIFNSYELLDEKQKQTLNKGIVENCVPNKRSFDNNYSSQILLFEKLLTLDEQYNDLLLQIIKSHCTFVFQRTESARMALNIYTIFLGWSDGVEKYRNLLWNLINKLYKELKSCRLGELCNSITNYHTLTSVEQTMKHEYELFGNFISKINPNNTFKKLFKFELAKNYSIIAKKNRNLVFDFKDDILLNIINAEEKNSYKWPQKYDELKRIISKLNLSEIRNLFKELAESVTFYGDKNYWHIINIISTLFDLKVYKNFTRFDILKLTNKYCPNIGLRPSYIVNKISEEMTMANLRSFLYKSNFKYKWNWVLATYMYEKSINNKLLGECQNLFSNLNSRQDYYGNDSILNLKEYFEYDNNFFVKITKYVLDVDNINLLNMFEPIFYEKDLSVALGYYENDINVLIELYFKMIEKHSHIDYEKRFISYFIDQDSRNLSRYLDIVKNESLSFIWQRSDAEDLVYDYFEKLINDKHKILYRFDLESVLAEAEPALKMKIIKNIILKHFDNHIVLFEISCLISDYKEDLQREFIKFLIENKYPPEELIKLSIADGPHSWSGSEAPLVENNIKFLDKLIADLRQEGVSSDYLTKLNQIKSWREERLKRVKIDEYNKGYLSNV